MGSSSSSSSSSLPTQKSSKNSPPKPHKKPECSATHLLTITSFLLVITFQALALYKSTQPTGPTPNHNPYSSDPLTFLPLKDPRTPPYTDPNRTWFMSSLIGRSVNGMPEHFIFPSRHPHNRILCINPTKRTYALASPENNFPANGTVLRGLTFVADSFYDYENPWHSLNAISVFFSWMRVNGCLKPSRFVLFKNGEAVKGVGGWISSLMQASQGNGGGGGGGGAIDSLERYGVTCFEKAVVFRRGLGKMSSERRHDLFDMLRCKAWEFCNASSSVTTERRSKGREGFVGVRISLVGREGKRAFKNESGVKMVMERECNKVPGCSLRLIHLKNMSFCDQVRVMGNTDILVSTHGAQLTNMMFMPKGSSVMEMFPRGWLEGAGIGQFIYRWFASWSDMRYEGAWRDTDGIGCPPTAGKNRTRCFNLMQKDQQVGLNETYLANWIARVVRSKVYMKGSSSVPASHSIRCSC